MPHSLPSQSLRQESHGELIAFPYPSEPRPLRHRTVDPPSADGYSADGETDRAPDTIKGESAMIAIDDAFDAIARTLGASHASVFIAIRRGGNGGTRSAMSYNDIADACRLSRRQSMRIVASLIEADWLRLLPQTGRRGERLTNVFDLTYPSDIPSDTIMSPPGDNPSDMGGDIPSDIPPYNPPLVSQLVKDLNKQTDKQTARTDAPVELTVINPNESVWLSLLGDRVEKLERKFGRISDEFTGGMVRTMLLHAEARLGPVPAEPLMAGIQAAVTAIERQLKAEQNGGKPIRNLGRYGSKIIADKIAEVMA